MFSEIIERARQKSRQRIEEAFTDFSGGVSEKDSKKSRRLTLDAANSQPITENIRLPFDDETVDWIACHQLR